MTPLLFTVLAIVGFLSGFVQGASGMGFALIMAPLIGLLRPELLPVSVLILMMPLIGLGLAFSARLHVMEKVGAGVGFASITTIGIMFGQNLHPYQDLVFSDLYRITSVTVSLVVTLTLVFLMHRMLNCFAATRFVVSD